MTWTVGLLALLISAGAGSVWGYERHVHSYTQHMRDRLVRLTFAGAIWLSFYAYPTYLIYIHYFSDSNVKIQQLPAWIWPCLIGSVVLPWIAGDITGRIRRSKLPDSSSIAIPTGFDYVITSLKANPSIILIVHLNTNMVVIGCPKRAATTPNMLDIYLSPIFFQGTTDQFLARMVRSGSNPDQLNFEIDELNLISDQPLQRRQKDGILVKYEDVTYIYVHFPNEPKPTQQEDITHG